MSPEEPDDHPLAPQHPKQLPPKYLKPISPREKRNAPKTPHRRESASQNECFTPPRSAQPRPTIVPRRNKRDSVSTADSGKSTLSDASSDSFLFKEEIVSPRKKSSEIKVEPAVKRKGKYTAIVLIYLTRTRLPSYWDIDKQCMSRSGTVCLQYVLLKFE